MKRFRLVVAAAIMMCASSWGQNNPPRPDPREFFRLNFVLTETENGKAVNTRSFQTMVPTDDGAVSSIRSGDKIPVNTSNSVMTYLDIGVSLDVKRLHRNNEELTLDLVAEVSSADSVSGNPVVRQVRWNSSVVIPIGKNVVLFLSDGPTAKRQMQLEVTAKPVH
jgi:hypothetical protein